MVATTRYKRDVFTSYSRMDGFPTHNGRYYWRPNRTNMETHVSYDVHGNHQLRKKEDDFQNWISQILRTNSMSHQFITHRIHFFILCFQHDECHYIFTMLIWKIENHSWVFSSILSSYGRCVILY